MYVKLPASPGVKVAPEEILSLIFKVTVALAILMVVGILFTVTVIFLLSAGAYCSLPSKITVIVAVPSLNPLIIPFASTVTTVLLLEVYVKLPASPGVKVAPEEILSLIFKVTVELTILMVVGILLFFKLMVYDAVSNLPVTPASPLCLAVYNTSSPIKAVVLSNSPNV